MNPSQGLYAGGMLMLAAAVILEALEKKRERERSGDTWKKATLDGNGSSSSRQSAQPPSSLPTN